MTINQCFDEQTPQKHQKGDLNLKRVNLRVVQRNLLKSIGICQLFKIQITVRQGPSYEDLSK